jgi:methionyl aminopeptidase
MMTQVKNEAEIERMRTSGKMLAHILRYLEPALKPGVTTRELDRLAAAELEAIGGQPAFYNHDGFPGVLCVAVNNEVVHGIPGHRQLAEGDIIGLDFGVRFEGMITDAAVTLPVGEVDEETRRLLRVTREALDRGIGAVRDGARVGDISHAVETRLLQDKLGVIEELSGHGVGHDLHEDPMILNYGRAGTGMRLKAGMTIAIEPMATLGGKDIYLADDHWTILTTDGSRAAQFEHTVLVTESGAEILTK